MIRSPKTAKIGHEGTCPVCWHTQSVAGERMVLHGYRRPGDGETYGNCAGYGKRAFELTAEDAVWYRDVVANEYARMLEFLRLLGTDRVDALQVQDLSKPKKLMGKTVGYESRTVRRGDPDWQQVVERTMRRVKGEIDLCTEDLADRARRIDAWKPGALVAYDIAERVHQEREAVAARRAAKKERAAAERRNRRLKEAFEEIGRAVRWHAEEPEWLTRQRQTLRPGEIGTFVEVYTKTPAQFLKEQKARAKAAQ